MQNKQFRLSYLVVIILIGVLVFYLGFTSYRRNVPRDLFQVYVDGKVIGIIESEEEFDNYINKKQEDIKKKYGINKVYMPNGVVVKAVTTYNSNIDTNEEVYNEIVKMKQFTIKGVTIEINNEEIEDYQTLFHLLLSLSPYHQHILDINL